MITLYRTIFMESYAHFKVMLTALSWGNLLGVEGASVFLVVLVFTLPEPHLICVAAFSFCSNFQPEFSKLSVDFMNFCHLTPSWPSEGGEPEQPERVFWLWVHYNTWKRTNKLIWTTKMLCFVEQNGRNFEGSLYSVNFFLLVHAMGEGGSLDIMFKGFVSVKKRCQKARGTGSKGSKKAKTLDTATAMWPWKNWQTLGLNNG